MAYIIGVHNTFPINYYKQEEISQLLIKMWPDKEKYINQFSNSSLVKGRHTSLNLDEYSNLGDFGKRNTHWIKTALDLQKINLSYMFEEYQINPSQIDAIFSTSVTGLSIPTLESKLMNEFKINSSAKRIPLFGLGCLGGVAGINRVHDYLKSYPKELVLFIATELCTLTFQFNDKSIANLVGTSLFADGSAVVLMCGEEHELAKNAKLKTISNASFFYPNTENVMGWDIVSTGFQIVLSGNVPEIVSTHVQGNLFSFLEKNKKKLNNVDFFISHPGGPKVLEALCDISKKDHSWFYHSFLSLENRGNMSSVSVLDVMRNIFLDNKLKKNQLGVMIAMGPAFASEFALVQAV